MRKGGVEQSVEGLGFGHALVSLWVQFTGKPGMQKTTRLNNHTERNIQMRLKFLPFALVE